MPSDRTAVIFCWSLAPEPAFLDGLNREYSDYVIYPLRQEAYDSAVTFVPAEKIGDLSALVAPDQREKIHEQAISQLNECRRLYLKRKLNPWIMRYLTYECDHILYYLNYWSEALARATELHNNARIQLHGLFSSLAVTGETIISATVLQALMDSRGVGQKKNHIKAAVLCVVDAVIHSSLTKLLFRPEPHYRSSRCDCLVAGIQSADSIFQEELVGRLVESGLKSVKWVVTSESHTRRSEDELSGAGRSQSANDIKEQVPALRDSVWKSNRLSRLSDQCAAVTLAELLEEVMTGLVNPAACRRIAEFMISTYSGTASTYFRIEAVLRKHRPLNIVGSSVVGEMIHVREWARLNGTPFIRLPHGVESIPEMDYVWDADAIGVMGRHLASEVERLYPERKDKIGRVGGVYLSAQSLDAQKNSESKRSRKKGICFLVGGFYMTNYPDTYGEVLADMSALAEIAKGFGRRLTVRCHPRSGERSLFERAIFEASDSGADVVFSDGTASLVEDLQNAEVAVIRFWSGVGIRALYADVPLVGWIPRRGVASFRKITEALPVSAGSIDELKSALSELLEQESYVRKILEQQKVYLSNQIENPFSEPYEAAVQFILEECGYEANTLSQ